MERRMAILFVVALLLIGWQAWRIAPSSLPTYRMAVEPEEQLFPVAAPLFRHQEAMPTALAEASTRRQALSERSVSWPGRALLSDCDLFVHIGRHHWARAGVSRAELARLLDPGAVPPGDGRAALLRLDAGALADDDDGNGDALDAGELSTASGRLEAEAYCGPRPEALP